jgi:hypothetical protein
MRALLACLGFKHLTCQVESGKVPSVNEQLKSEQSYNATANTDECFSICIGRRVIGVLFDALPVNRRDIAAGTKTLVFEDGYGLTISSAGSFWTEDKDEIARAIRYKREELSKTSAEIEGVLALAGVRRDTITGGRRS